MRRGRKLETTLGDLIVAVTDEVAPYVPDPRTVYVVVECILSDLMVREHVQFHAHAARRPRVYH